MKEDQKYKTIRKILQNVSLIRRDSDWEKMSGLLSRHLPVKTPSVNPFHSVKLLVYGGSVVLVTAVAVLIHPAFHNSKKHKSEMIPAEQTIQTIDSGRAVLPPGKETESLKKLSSDSLDPIKKENIISSDTVTMTAAVSNQNETSDSFTHAEQTETNKSALPGKQDEIQRFSNTHPVRSGKKEQSIDPDNEQKEKSKNSSEPFLTRSNTKGSGGSSVKHKAAYDLNVFLSEQGRSRQVSEHDKHSSWISQASPGKKILSNGMKLFTGNKVTKKKIDGGSYFRYGFSLPLLQYYTSNPNQVFQVNYIPGLIGQYFINRRWGFGMNISPYQKIPVSDKDSIYSSFGRDSSISPNNSYTKKYYLNNLNAWSAEINLDYQINGHLGIEAGLGFQGIWNARGYAVTLSRDSLNTPPYTGTSTSTQNMHYARGDQSLASLEKTNLYYSLTLVYQEEKWAVSLGYNQNAKTWLPAAQGKSPGWIKLQFNYYFSMGEKIKKRP